MEINKKQSRLIVLAYGRKRDKVTTDKILKGNMVYKSVLAPLLESDKFEFVYCRPVNANFVQRKSKRDGTI